MFVLSSTNEKSKLAELGASLEESFDMEDIIIVLTDSDGFSIVQPVEDGLFFGLSAYGCGDDSEVVWDDCSELPVFYVDSYGKAKASIIKVKELLELINDFIR